MNYSAAPQRTAPPRFRSRMIATGVVAPHPACSLTRGAKLRENSVDNAAPLALPGRSRAAFQFNYPFIFFESRSASRFLIVSRLSQRFLPLPTAITSFM